PAYYEVRGAIRVSAKRHPGTGESPAIHRARSPVIRIVDEARSADLDHAPTAHERTFMRDVASECPPKFCQPPQFDLQLDEVTSRIAHGGFEHHPAFSGRPADDDGRYAVGAELGQACRRIRSAIHRKVRGAGRVGAELHPGAGEAAALDSPRLPVVGLLQ